MYYTYIINIQMSIILLCYCYNNRLVARHANGHSVPTCLCEHLFGIFLCKMYNEQVFDLSLIAKVSFLLIKVEHLFEQTNGAKHFNTLKCYTAPE